MSILLVSGGQDSVTCAAWAMARVDEPHTAIMFQYGQRHSTETAYAMKAMKALSERLGKPSPDWFNLDIAKAMSGLESDLLYKVGKFQHGTDKSLPSSFVPGRNMIFLSFAAAYAGVLKARSIIAGFSQTDYSGYPDCRDVFVRHMEGAINAALDAPQFNPVIVTCPLMNKSKAETFKLADELGVLDIIIESTMTCYNGSPAMHDWGRGCGECPACLLRKKGWEEYAVLRGGK